MSTRTVGTPAIRIATIGRAIGAVRVAWSIAAHIDARIFFFVSTAAAARRDREQHDQSKAAKGVPVHAQLSSSNWWAKKASTKTRASSTVRTCWMLWRSLAAPRMPWVK